MKFTVLLSLYNKESEHHLFDCLESIKLNTKKPEQVVIVYDGPISRELDSVVNSFIKYLPIEKIELPENVGLGNALNYGLNFCRNEIVFRMDTDDKCKHTRFERQLEIINIRNDIVLMGSAIEEFDESMAVSFGIRFSTEQHDDIIRYAKKRNPFNHMSVVFKKSIIQALGGYKHHYFMEDYNLWLRTIAAGYKTYNIPEVLVYVRGGKNMLSRRKGISYIRSELKLAKLKYNLKIDSGMGIIICAAIRILPRLLPVSLLKQVYKTLRRNKP
ncbi:glycosyltransferase [Escherichia albertii]